MGLTAEIVAAHVSNNPVALADLPNLIQEVYRTLSNVGQPQAKPEPERPQPAVREHDCVGCRLCYNVCPVERCIEMVPLASGRDPITWDQLAASRPDVTEDWDAMKRYRELMGIHIH